MNRSEMPRAMEGDMTRPGRPARCHRNWIFAALLAAVSFAAPQGVWAATKPDVREIMQAVYDREDGDDMSADLTMILVDSNGNRTMRHLRTYRKDFATAAFQIIQGVSPEDIRGAGLLSYDYMEPGKADDQWLFMPGMKTAHRITVTEKNESFLDSDFNHSDMTRPDLLAYNYKLMKEPKVDGVPMWQIEVLPRTREVAAWSGYSKSMLWVRKDNSLIVRAVRWVYNNRRIKYMQVTAFVQLEGVWVASEVQMIAKEGVETMHATLLQLSNIKFNDKLNQRLFTVRSLEKGLN